MPATPPSQIRMVHFQGTVQIGLSPTDRYLVGTTKATFLNATASFLASKLPLVQTDSVIVKLIRQMLQTGRRTAARRQLQTSSTGTLLVDLNVSGIRIALNSQPFDVNQKLVDIFQQTQQEYISDLVATNDPYFATIGQVTVPSASSAAAPSNSKSMPLSLGAIIGIAVGGAVLIVIILFLWIKLMAKKESPPPNKGPIISDMSFISEPTLNDLESQPDPKKARKSWLRKSQNKKKKPPLAQQSSKESSAPRPPNSVPESMSDIENSTLYSYSRDNQSYMGTATVDNLETDTLAGADTMSYAYSLDAGIENSVMGDSVPPYGDMENKYDVPVEIPHVNGNGNHSANEEGTSSRRPSSHLSEPPSDYDIDMSPSDLELTQSELAMLPSNLKGTMSSEGERQEMVTREVFAPAGKLGVVIDTTVEGPVVHKVNEGSALHGRLWPGDVIVAIDDIDTRAMSASAITQLMVKTANRRRKLTVVSAEQ